MTETHFLVIGGGGFLGRAIIDQIIPTGAKISVFDLRKPKEEITGVSKFIIGDITNYEAVENACIGMDRS
jgi:nucleoside-diphosphate-sugar epimerase